METIYDPLRRKEVAATPEERVRQWFITVLQQRLGVPPHMMMSEVGFKWGEKSYRADILVYGKGLKPLAVVECKRPDVALTAAVAEQAMRYNAVLDVKWIFLTNGISTIPFERDGAVFRMSTDLPQTLYEP